MPGCGSKPLVSRETHRERREPDDRGLNIDLHTHSNCSDGVLTPAELVARAAAAGVEVLALTDHDTITGLEQAQRSASALGVRLVPGVEISASWRAQSLHVLGLWVDPASAELCSVLRTQGERRTERMRKICARLEKQGLPGSELLAAVQASPGVPTRMHLANALVAGGHVDSADQAFRKYLGAGKSANLAGRMARARHRRRDGSAPRAASPRWPIRRATPSHPARAVSSSAISSPPEVPRSKW